MRDSIYGQTQKQMVEHITRYVENTPGLSLTGSDPRKLCIEQRVDGKALNISCAQLEAVLLREDSEGKSFIQINFQSGQKILVTEHFIGFKPAFHPELEMEKLPRVVTTPDLVSVFEAIQEAIDMGDGHREDVLLLKRVFDSLLAGGEAVGFDLSTERSWFLRLPFNSGVKGTA